MAYCSRDFVVNRHMELLTTRWLSFVMTTEPAIDTVTYYVSKAQIEAGFWLVASTKMVPFMVSGFSLDVFHFKTTF